MGEKFLIRMQPYALALSPPIFLFACVMTMRSEYIMVQQEKTVFYTKHHCRVFEDGYVCKDGAVRT